MLKKGINLITVILFITPFFSCRDSKIKSETYIKDNYKNYSSIHTLIRDSVNRYIDSLLAEFTPEYMYGYRVDSLVCINSSKDKLVAMTIEIPNQGKGFLSDDAMKLLGKKINTKWYFFRGGGTLTIPRDMYGFSEMNPPSQFFLSQIARKEFLESALIKNDKGEYVVDDKWIDDHFYNIGYGRFKTQAQYDSVHWFYIMDKWKHKIDTNEYKPLKKNNEQNPNS